MARGAATVAGQRILRELALEHTHGRIHPWPRRLTSLLATGILAWMILHLAPTTAAQIGDEIVDLNQTIFGNPWLAGLLEDIGGWWESQPLAVKILVGIAIGAAIVASGGSLALGIGLSGGILAGLDHATGTAAFIRDPRQTTRDYFTTATPGQILLDAGGLALNFVPGGIGAAGGRTVRGVADDIVADPRAWWTARRHMIHDASTTRWADDAGAIDMSHFQRRDPVPLGDGTTKAALSPADEAAATARHQTYTEVPVKGAAGPAKDYQIKVYGENERRIPIDKKPDGTAINAEPDGFTAQYGAVGDSKYVGNPDGTFYNPDTLPKEKLRQFATEKMDNTLQKYQKAADKVMGDGNGVVELTTNDPKAAEWIESRLKALKIRGYVRIVPN